MTLPTLTASLLALAAAAGTAPADPATSGDLARLQGRWTANAGARGKVPVILEIRGSNVSVHFKTPQGLTVRAEGAVRINESTTPRSLDWVDFTAPDGEELPRILSIYELDGEAFRLCNGGLNDPRPSTFKAGESPLASVVTFRRASAEPAKPDPKGHLVFPDGSR